MSAVIFKVELKNDRAVNIVSLKMIVLVIVVAPLFEFPISQVVLKVVLNEATNYIKMYDKINSTRLYF